MEGERSRLSTADTCGWGRPERGRQRGRRQRQWRRQQRRRRRRRHGTTRHGPAGRDGTEGGLEGRVRSRLPHTRRPCGHTLGGWGCAAGRDRHVGGGGQETGLLRACGENKNPHCAAAAGSGEARCMGAWVRVRVRLRHHKRLSARVPASPLGRAPSAARRAPSAPLASASLARAPRHATPRAAPASRRVSVTWRSSPVPPHHMLVTPAPRPPTRPRPTSSSPPLARVQPAPSARQPCHHSAARDGCPREGGCTGRSVKRTVAAMCRQPLPPAQSLQGWPRGLRGHGHACPVAQYSARLLSAHPTL